MTTKVLLKSFIVNLILGIAKIIGGYFTNSKTLLSDGVHCMSDMSTDVIGLVGSKLAMKKPDETHPFGHGKIEYVTSMMMSLLIIFMGLGMLIKSFEPANKILDINAIFILSICILTKIILSKYLLKKGRELNNEIILTNATESKYDSYSSILALFFILLGLFQNDIPIFKYTDVIGSVIISILTIRIGFVLCIKNMKSVIGEIDTDKNRIDSIKRLILKHKKVLEIKRISILKYGHYESLIVEIKIDEETKIKNSYKLETKIKEELKQLDNRIKYVTVNIEPYKKAH